MRADSLGRLPAAVVAVLAAAGGGAVLAAERVEVLGNVEPDPAIVAVAAAGAEPASAWVRGCPGHVAAEAALTVGMTGPYAALRVHAAGAGLAGVVVAGPDGVHHCAAADETGLAVLPLGRALEGDYAIWPSAAVPGAPVEATVLLTLRELYPDEIAWHLGGGAAALGAGAPPAAGTVALAEDDPEDVAELDVSLPASFDGLIAVPGCAGMIDPRRADAVVTLPLDAAELHFLAMAETDTTLVVRDPAGALHCADDSFGMHPAVRIDGAPAGDYAVWVGVFGEAPGMVAALSAGRVEMVPPGMDAGGGPGLGLGLPPSAGTVDLPEAGAMTVGVAVNPVEMAASAGTDCAGMIDPAQPDVVVSVPQGAEAAWFRATAPADATLLVVAPDGEVRCNDDAVGSDPVVAFEPAAPGDYAVWVGIFGGGDPVEAALIVARSAADVGAEGLSADGGPVEMPNPFAGRALASAAEALRIAMEEEGLAETLSYARIEEEGTQGFTLHDVVLTDPDPSAPQLRIARLRVADLDLEGLEATGEPRTFLIEADGIAYADLAGWMAALGLPPIPEFAGEPSMAFTVGLQTPDGDMARRTAVLRLTLDGLLGLGFEARLRWPEGAEAPFDPDAVLTESVEAELRDLGFVAALLAVQAEAMGTTVEELRAMALEGLAESMQPAPPGSRAARVLEVLGAALAGADRPGAIRLRMATAEPTGLEALIEELATGAEEDGRLEFEMSYAPL